MLTAVLPSLEPPGFNQYKRFSEEKKDKPRLISWTDLDKLSSLLPPRLCVMRKDGILKS